MNARGGLRQVVEEALRSPDIPTLADNEIARLLGVSGRFVGCCRRLLETSGDILAVDRRLGRNGSVIDVRRIGKYRQEKGERK